MMRTNVSSCWYYMWHWLSYLKLIVLSIQSIPMLRVPPVEMRLKKRKEKTLSIDGYVLTLL